MPTCVNNEPILQTGHFKCNIRMLKEYPNIQNYTREIYQMDGVKDTINFQHIKVCSATLVLNASLGSQVILLSIHIFKGTLHAEPSNNKSQRNCRKGTPARL